MRQAPSRIENSEWTWRWTKGGVSGTGKSSYKGVRRALFSSLCRLSGDALGLTDRPPRGARGARKLVRSPRLQRPEREVRRRARKRRRREHRLSAERAQRRLRVL